MTKTVDWVIKLFYLFYLRVFRPVTLVQVQLQRTIPEIQVCLLVIFIFLSSKYQISYSVAPTYVTSNNIKSLQIHGMPIINPSILILGLPTEILGVSTSIEPWNNRIKICFISEVLTKPAEILGFQAKNVGVPFSRQSCYYKYNIMKYYNSWWM